MMKNILVCVAILFASSSIVQAQETLSAKLVLPDNAAVDFASTSAARVNLIGDRGVVDTVLISNATSSTSPVAEAPALVTILAVPASLADPQPAPTPKPSFFHGERDDYRWQLALGFSLVKFRSSIFDATAAGVNTSLAYYVNSWLAAEGTVSAVFAPPLTGNNHVKLTIYGAGPKVSWQQGKWDPWVHLIVGGIHEQPQTAGNGRNGLAIQAGGGADYRFLPRFSARVGGDYVRSQLFGTGQNNFQFVAGLVFHF